MDYGDRITNYGDSAFNSTAIAPGKKGKRGCLTTLFCAPPPPASREGTLILRFPLSQFMVTLLL